MSSRKGSGESRATSFEAGETGVRESGEPICTAGEAGASSSDERDWGFINRCWTTNLQGFSLRNEIQNLKFIYQIHIISEVMFDRKWSSVETFIPALTDR